MGEGNRKDLSVKAEKILNSAEVGIQKLDVTIRGIEGSPLVVHAFEEKAKEQIRGKQQKVPRKAKEQRDPKAEFLAARYLDAAGRECFKATSLKLAIIAAASAFEDLTKVGLRQAFFVRPAGGAGELIPILTWDDAPAEGVMREDAVTIGIATRDLRYRPVYAQWKARVSIDYNPRLVSRDQLLALMDQAGWGVGIHEGRPQKSALGWGRFERVG